MSKGPAVRASEVQFDGSLPPLAHGSGRLTNAAAAQQGPVIVLPYNAYIERVYYFIDTVFTNALSLLGVGSIASVKTNLIGIPLQNVVAGFWEIDPGAFLGATGRTIPRGTPIAFGLDAADTTGKITATMILRPAS